jgi:Helix-hairpin-helix domain
MDDFKLIKGVGPAIERRLHDAGVTTFAQLAGLSPDRISTLVENVGGVSTERIVSQDWIGRAGELASVSADRTKGASTDSEARPEVATVAPPLDAAGSGEVLNDLRLELDDASFDEIVPHEGEADTGRLRAEIGFRISGARASEVVSRQPNYFVHVLAEVEESDEMAVLAVAHGRLRPGLLDYRTTVEFTAPDIGRYQLLATVVISDYNAVGVTVGPKLKVIP